MSYKRTLIFLIVFVALAAFFYLYDVKGGEKRKEAEEKAKLLLSFKPEDVTTLALAKTDQRVVVKKENDKWNITEPVSAPTEQSRVDQMLKTLAELKYERDLGAQTDLDSFGLSKPEAEIEIKDSQGDLGKLLLGAATPDGSNFYVKRAAEKQVFTVPKSARGKIDLTLFDMRDKTVFDFSPVNVKALTVSRDGHSLKFENKSEGQWQMTSPEEHRADTTRITSLLDSVKYSKVKKFVEEDAADLDTYGLTRPSACVEITLGDKIEALSFGKPVPGSTNMYATRDDSRQVIELDADIFKKLSADVDNWRDKHLVKFEIPKVSKVEIESPEGRVAVERSSKNSDEWKLIEPRQTMADSEKVDTLLTDLQNAKASEFLKPKESKTAEPAFKNPMLTLRVWTEEKEPPMTLLISKSGAKPQIYARTGGGEILAVDGQLLDKLSVGPSTLIDKSVIRFKADDVQKIEVTHGEKSFKISRSGVQWHVPAGLDIESYKVDQFLWDLRAMKYKAIGPREQDDKAYGFDSRALTIELLGSDEKKPLHVVIGKKTPEKNSYYVVAGDDGQVMEVEDTHISEWLNTF